MDKTWSDRFREKHGERIVFMAAAAFMGCVLIGLGESYGIQQLSGSGYTILTGVAMLLFNKARGPQNNPESESK